MTAYVCICRRKKMQKNLVKSSVVFQPIHKRPRVRSVAVNMQYASLFKMPPLWVTEVRHGLFTINGRLCGHCVTHDDCVQQKSYLRPCEVNRTILAGCEDGIKFLRQGYITLISLLRSGQGQLILPYCYQLNFLKQGWATNFFFFFPRGPYWLEYNKIHTTNCVV